MNIQKVKELALANGFKLKEQASVNMDLNAYVYDFANAVEREVKAQSDQKIKLLLCDEHLKKCESPTGVFNSQYSDEEPCLICLAKQAKAQAVPEGFVLEENKVAEKIELIIRDVAELPDRTSPEDWPEALIVTSVELEEILTQHLSEKCRN